MKSSHNPLSRSKISSLQIGTKWHLTNPDKETRFIFCQKFLNLYREAIHNSMTGEASFHLDGVVKKQKFRHWEVENPRKKSP